MDREKRENPYFYTMIKRVKMIKEKQRQMFRAEITKDMQTMPVRKVARNHNVTKEYCWKVVRES